MKIDFHCHIFEQNADLKLVSAQFHQFVGYGFFERMKKGIQGVTPHKDEDIIKKTLYFVQKRAQLDKIVLLPLSIKQNQVVLEWCKRAPDIFIPFFNPPEKSLKGIDPQNALRDAIKNNGIRGLKIMNSFRKKFLDDKALYSSFEVAEEYNILALFHTGYPPPGTNKDVLTYSNPLRIENIIQSFPRLKIIIAHMGFPWVDNALALAVQYPNIYLDISNLIYMMPNRLKELLLRAKELIGLEKILFGTDGFIPEMIEYTVKTFEAVDYLSEQEIKKIMGLNAKKLLNL